MQAVDYGCTGYGDFNLDEAVNSFDRTSSLISRLTSNLDKSRTLI